MAIKNEVQEAEVEPAEKIPSPLPEATDPYPSRECPELRRERDDYPEVVPPDDKNYHGAAGPPIAPDGDYEHTFEKNMPKRVCFHPRRRGLVIILLLVITIIAAIIGGSVGGLVMSKRVSKNNFWRTNFMGKLCSEIEIRLEQGPVSIAKSPEQRSIAAATCGEYLTVAFQEYSGNLGVIASAIYSIDSNNSHWFRHHSRADLRMNSPITLGCGMDDREEYLYIYYINKENELCSTKLDLTPNADGYMNETGFHHNITLLPSDSRFAAVTSRSGDTSFLFISNEAGVVSQFNVSSRPSPPPVHDLRTYPSSPMATIYNHSDCQLYWINQQGYLEGGSKNIFIDGSWAGVSTSNYPFATLPLSMAVTLSGSSKIFRIMYLEGTQVKQIIHANWTYSVGGQHGSKLPESSIPFGPIAAVTDVEFSRLYYVVDDKIIEMTWSGETGWQYGKMPSIGWRVGR
ncbi:hypothetical protein FQN51_002393 [Onygenales sp. PD_10]|nr:hypothetical protein FQN51_002393 [Onygenales sp. PD_10]